MKQTLLVLLFIAIVIITKAQPPAGYYNTASGKTGAELKTALYNIIKGHTQVSYTPGVWNAFYTTDKKPNGKVWDMYSDIPSGTPPYEYTLGSDQGSSSSTEGCCYNREHSFPKSWFGDVPPMNVDIFHIYPTDVTVNNARGNMPYGTVSAPRWTSMNGSKIGPCSASGYSGEVFEPIDEYKGDFARTYFYMATRYENIISTWHSNDNNNGEAVLQANSFPVFETWILNLLIKWNTTDPVSQKEVNRNNAVYAIQKNRNPYIDHPEYANSVWGTNVGISDSPAQVALQVYPNPVSDACSVTLPSDYNQQNSGFAVYSSTGIPVFAPVTISGNKATLNLENLPSGFYLVRLATNNFNTFYQARIIKK
jgi:endonuclease I